MSGIDLLLDGLVLIGELLCIGDHLLDLFLAEATLIVGDRDCLGFADTLLKTSDGEDTVLIDLESDLNLSNTSGSGGDSVEVELTEVMVILDKGTLTFEDGDGDSSLLVLVGGEGLGLLGGDNSSALNNGGHDTADSLDTKGEGCNINEKNA